MVRLSIVAVVALCALSSCDSGSVEAVPEQAPVSIKIGTFFGECVGYCYSETTINPTNAIYVEWADDSRKFPERSRTATVTQEEWRDLVESVSMSRLVALDSVIGCPDCNDSGGEWVEVRSPGQVKRVVFEHGATVESIQDLLGRARALRTRVKL